MEVKAADLGRCVELAPHGKLLQRPLDTEFFLLSDPQSCPFCEQLLTYETGMQFLLFDFCYRVFIPCVGQKLSLRHGIGFPQQKLCFSVTKL